MDVWKNFSHHRSNFNFTELIAEFRSLNETDQLELINDIIVGNSTDDMLAGQSLAELINKTGGLLPFMLASASNTTNITLVISKTLMRAFSTGVEGNSSGFQMQLLSFWIKEFFDTIPSQTQSDQPSNTTTTKKSGVSSPSSASLLTFVIIVSTKILYY